LAARRAMVRKHSQTNSASAAAGERRDGFDRGRGTSFHLNFVLPTLVRPGLEHLSLRREPKSIAEMGTPAFPVRLHVADACVNPRLTRTDASALPPARGVALGVSRVDLLFQTFSRAASSVCAVDARAWQRVCQSRRKGSHRCRDRARRAPEGRAGHLPKNVSPRRCAGAGQSPPPAHHSRSAPRA
jgi:hypothetical protein